MHRHSVLAMQEGVANQNSAVQVFGGAGLTLDVEDMRKRIGNAENDVATCCYRGKVGVQNLNRSRGNCTECRKEIARVLFTRSLSVASKGNDVAMVLPV
jgi:hypothetical protein